MKPEDFIPDLVQWEGRFGWMYLDRVGLPTVGVGNLLKNLSDALALPFLKGKVAATADEITFNYAAIQALPANQNVNHYKLPDSVILPDAAIDKLLRSRLSGDFLPGLRRGFRDFDTFPSPAQRALVDMIFTLGYAGLFGDASAKKDGFPKLVLACRQRRFDVAANQCNRVGGRASRNKWTSERFAEAAKAA